MDDLKDILLDGEEVIWSGHPDWARAEQPKPVFQRKVIHFTWIIGLISSVIILTIVGNMDGTQGFVQVVLGIIIAVFVIALIPTIGTFFQKSETANSRPDDLYAITDHRLILHNREKDSVESFAHSSIQRLERFRNGEVHGLSLQFANGEDDFRTLHALADAEQVERTIVENFIVRKEHS